MSDSQVVYADHNDRVQDNDLAKRTRFLPWDTRCRRDASRPRRLRRPQHCPWMLLSLSDILLAPTVHIRGHVIFIFYFGKC